MVAPPVGRGTLLRRLWLAAACAAALIVAAPAAAEVDPGGTPGSGTEPPLTLAWPASGTVTRGFGDDPVLGDFHPGVDIGSLRSLAVHAAAPGVVEQVGYTTGFDGYGQIVLVGLGDGYQALYAHLSRVDAHPGELVETGAELGLAGSTGLSTGVHLHFELRRFGKAFDPAPLLPPANPTVP